MRHEMNGDKTTYVEIIGNMFRGACYIHCKPENSGMWSFYIPAFDIFYSAESKEEGNEIAPLVIKAFYKFWGREGKKDLVLKLHKLGFKAKRHSIEMTEFLHRKTNKIKLTQSYDTLPAQMQGASKQYLGELEFAA